MASIIPALPDSEKKALALCGISQDAQLAGINIDTLLSDLRKAQSYFPEEAGALTEARVREIYAAVAEAKETAPGNTAPAQQSQEAPADNTGLGRATVTSDVRTKAVPQSYPVLAPRRHQHRHRSNADKTSEEQRKAPALAQSVHCGRPIATYIGALSMLLFYAGLVFMLLIPVLLFLSYIQEDQIITAFILSALAMVPYFLHGLWVPCTVCNMKFFMLRHYNKNRHAHQIPFFGLTSLVTALHIVFFLWYRCPACGTSLRLFRKRH